MALFWSYRPVKRMFLPGDPFFEEGDIHCNILHKQANISEDLEDVINSSEPEFECSVLGCHECFINIKSYEAHYKSCHWNSCRFCKKSFQTSFLLDLHILENHDTLFQMIARKKHMYRCLVESCPDKFNGEDERKSHLVEVHRYPSDFRFNRPSRSQRKIKRKQADDSTREAASTQKPSTVSAMDTDICTTITNQNGKSSSGHNNITSKQRLPRTICFGRGSSRGFQRGSVPRGHSKGKNNNKKKQASSKSASSTEVVMEEVS